MACFNTVCMSVMNHGITGLLSHSSICVALQWLVRKCTGRKKTVHWTLSTLHPSQLHPASAFNSLCEDCVTGAGKMSTVGWFIWSCNTGNADRYQWKDELKKIWNHIHAKMLACSLMCIWIESLSSCLWFVGIILSSSCCHSIVSVGFSFPECRPWQKLIWLFQSGNLENCSSFNHDTFFGTDQNVPVVVSMDNCQVQKAGIEYIWSLPAFISVYFISFLLTALLSFITVLLNC